VKKIYIPGDRVPHSGIYRVHHDSHRLMHEATLLGGKFFPLCRQCGKDVRFELLKRVDERLVIARSHHAILEDWREGPQLVKATGS